MAEIIDNKPALAEPVVAEPPVVETEGAEQDAKKSTNTVPYSRFKEVVSEKNNAVERLSNLEEKFQKQLEFSQDLQNRFSQAEDILNAIRGMAADEKMKPHVMAIDKKLQGIEEEVDEGKITQAEGDKKIEKVINQHRAELQDAILTNRAELLFQSANERASRYLESLPKEYTDKDKEIIGRVWTQEVNWDGIEKDPTVLNQELAESLDRVLHWYGEPKGYIKTVEAPPTETKPVEPTPEMKAKAILDKEWAKLGDNGEPTYTDDEFKKEFADLLRHTKGK